MSGPPGPPGPRPVRVQTNTFAITQLPKHEYRQFDVTFVMPGKVPQPNREKKQRLFHHLQTVVAPEVFHPRMYYDGQKIAFGQISNDGSSRLTARQSFLVNLAINTVAPRDVRGTVEIIVNLAEAEVVKASHLEDMTVNKTSSTRATVAINLLQLIIRQAGNRQREQSRNNRAYFTQRNSRPIPGSGLEMWNGIFQSVRPTLGRMILNIDTTVAVFYQGGPFINFVMNALRAHDTRQLETLDDRSREFKKLEALVKGLQVTVTVREKTRTKTIKGLQLAAGKYRFEDPNVGERTVEDYFQETYGLRLRYPKVVGVRTSGKRDSEDAEIFPGELCTIPSGQFYKKKLPDDIIRELVSFSATKPADRLRTIKATAQEHTNSQDLAAAGLKIGAQPIMVDGQILQAPSLRYGTLEPFTPSGGQWNLVNPQRQYRKFIDPAVIHLWAIVNFATSTFGRQKVDNLATCLGQTCVNFGVLFREDPVIVEGHGFDVKKDLQKAFGMMKNIAQKRLPNANLKDVLPTINIVILIVLPQHAADIRTSIKHWGDTEEGVLTNCLREDKLRNLRPNDQYLSNVAQKLNPRMSGENANIVTPMLREMYQERRRVMVMGADVGHPGPGSQRPSVSSLVYTHSIFSTQYSAITNIQAPRQEIITDLFSFAREAVYETVTHKNEHGIDAVLFYRDGLSEGEFTSVATQEIAAIKDAFKAAYDRIWGEKKKLPKNAKLPLLVYIIVGKRHHITMYPETQDAGDRKGNCHPGTLIASGITHPSKDQKDFYLQSHSAIQGTARSSHYTIILDEIWGMENMAAIQELSYVLCYSYAKASRSVSIPAPVYYADSVCSRLPFHLDEGADSLLSRDNASISSGSHPPFDLAEWQRHFRPIHKNLKHKMYFL